MKIEELYQRVGGDYRLIKAALSSERIIKKYVLKFKDATCFAELKAHLEAGKMQEAFGSAHALKGICQNIGFASLQQSVAELTELLRPGNAPVIDTEAAKRLFAQVEKDYGLTLAAVLDYEAALIEEEE